MMINSCNRPGDNRAGPHRGSAGTGTDPQSPLRLQPWVGKSVADRFHIYNAGRVPAGRFHNVPVAGCRFQSSCSRWKQL